MAEWRPASGIEFAPALAKRLNTFFDRLAESYPDKVVIHFNRDHKKLAERGTELRRLAGYGEDNERFFADFGFTYVNALKQKTDSHGTYEDLVARLKEAFPDGIVCLYQAAAFRDDLSYFARKKMRTAKQILKNAGVLRERRPDEVIRPEEDTDDFDAPAEKQTAKVAETVVKEAAPAVEEPVVPIAEEPIVAEPVAEPAAETAEVVEPTAAEDRASGSETMLMGGVSMRIRSYFLLALFSSSRMASDSSICEGFGGIWPTGRMSREYLPLGSRASFQAQFPASTSERPREALLS